MSISRPFRRHHQQLQSLQASITSISRPFCCAAINMDYKASRPAFMSISRPFGCHHLKASIMRISHTQSQHHEHQPPQGQHHGHQPPLRLRSPAITKRQSQHHEHQPPLRLPSTAKNKASKPSIMTISRPQSQHQKHQPPLRLPSTATTKPAS